MRRMKDPIDNHVRRWLEEFELATAAEIKEIEAAVRREVDEAVEAAKAAPPPLQNHLVEPGVCAGDEGGAVRLCDSTLPLARAAGVEAP